MWLGVKNMKKKKRHINIAQDAGGLISSAGKTETFIKMNAFNSADAGVIIILASGDKIHLGQLR